MSVSAAFTFLAGFLALALRTLLARENRKLDEKYGAVERSKEQTRGEESALGIENYGPDFRYVL